MSLLEELKNYLDITWEDEGTDKKLDGILNLSLIHILRQFRSGEFP